VIPKQLLDRGGVWQRRRRRGAAAGRGDLARLVVVCPIFGGARRLGYSLWSKRLGQRPFTGLR